MNNSVKYPKPSKNNIYDLYTDEYVEYLYQHTRGLGKYKNNPLPCSLQQWSDIEVARNRTIVLYLLDGYKGVSELRTFEEEVKIENPTARIIETRNVSRQRARDILENGITNLGTTTDINT